MIVWIASYPKSGNTYMRALLASYFFTQDGNFNFEILKTIKIFPHINLFKNLGININDEIEVVKNYIRVQEEVNKLNKNSINFMKTHSTMQSINSNQFTDLKNTLGAIYLVRDPRNIVTSFSNHYDISIHEAAKDLMSFKYLKGVKNNKEFKDQVLTHMGSWADNYNSWKELKKYKKYILIRYEDLVSDPRKTFLDVINFINSFMKSKIIIDEKKLQNVIRTTGFTHLKNLEEKEGFEESHTDKKGNKISFFKYGPKNNWKQFITNDIREMIENSFNKEMKELDYL